MKRFRDVGEQLSRARHPQMGVSEGKGINKQKEIMAENF